MLTVLSSAGDEGGRELVPAPGAVWSRVPGRRLLHLPVSDAQAGDDREWWEDVPWWCMVGVSWPMGRGCVTGSVRGRIAYVCGIVRVCVTYVAGGLLADRARAV